MRTYYLKQFCGRFLFLIIILLFISDSAIPCTALVSTPTKFDSSEYIFIGRVINFLGPQQPDSLYRDYNSLLVEIIDPIYLPKTPLKYFEIIEPRDMSQKLLKAVNVKLSEELPYIKINVSIRKKMKRKP